MAVSFSGSGQVVSQVVSAIKTDTSQTSAQTYSDISGLSVSITPRNSANKILVFLDIQGSNDGGSMAIQLLRDSTQVAIATSGTGNQINTTLANYYNNADANVIRGCSVSYLDSPATTSSVTYKVQFRTGNNGTSSINRPSGNDNATYNMRTVSTITVMEIAYA
jgi:hypothetical protein